MYEKKWKRQKEEIKACLQDQVKIRKQTKNKQYSYLMWNEVGGNGKCGSGYLYNFSPGFASYKVSLPKQGNDMDSAWAVSQGEGWFIFQGV